MRSIPKKKILGMLLAVVGHLAVADSPVPSDRLQPSEFLQSYGTNQLMSQLLSETLQKMSSNSGSIAAPRSLDISTPGFRGCVPHKVANADKSFSDADVARMNQNPKHPGFWFMTVDCRDGTNPVTYNTSVFCEIEKNDKEFPGFSECASRHLKTEIVGLPAKVILEKGEAEKEKDCDWVKTKKPEYLYSPKWKGGFCVGYVRCSKDERAFFVACTSPDKFPLPEGFPISYPLNEERFCRSADTCKAQKNAMFANIERISKNPTSVVQRAASKPDLIVRNQSPQKPVAGTNKPAHRKPDSVMETDSLVVSGGQ